MAGVQGGWLIAGAIVGFLYNHIGLGGILLIDVCTYVVSFTLYFGVRRGKHVVKQPEHVLAHLEGFGGSVARYVHELKEGLHYLNHRPAVIMLGTSWALFLGAMLTSNIVTAPFSERILHSGAVGYGQLNGAWGMGAFISALFAANFISRFSGRRTVSIMMGILGVGMFFAPYTRWQAVAVSSYLIMGCARGLAGIAINSSIMEYVPKEMMGRVQNTFYFAGTMLQLFLGLMVGTMAYRYSLTWAFAIIAAVYGTSSLLTMLPAAKAPVLESEAQSVTTVAQ
jgi:MFS family permease